MTKNTKLDSQQINIITDYAVNYNPIEKTAFAEFIRERRKEYNEEYGQEISTSDLGRMLGIKYEMFRKILNQEKPTKKRDCIISICIALRRTPGEIDEALRLYQYMPALNENDTRDSFIMDQIIDNPNISVLELNNRLLQRGLSGLDIHNKRGGKKADKAPSVSLSIPYEILKLKVRTPIDSNYYYGDPYNSLSTAYDPSRCHSTGDMILRDSNRNKIIHLIASTDGYFSSQISEVDDFPIVYKSFDESGDYRKYFIELNSTIRKEKRRLLSILNDTKNYQKRVSARLIGDYINVFAEEFNYSIPELNEYYVLCFFNGKYRFEVYKSSAFMYYFLPESEFKKYYGNNIPKVMESYDSINQLEDLIQTTDKYSDENIRYRTYKQFFHKLQIIVDELFQRIKNHEEFIQNLRNIYDNPIDTLRFYKLEEDFECVYDEEYGEIYDFLKSKDYILSDESTITITLDDIFRAFELGFKGIEEIRRIKAKFGSIDAVLG